MFLRLFVYKVDGCTCEISEVVTGELDWSVGSHYYPSWMAREKGLFYGVLDTVAISVEYKQNCASTSHVRVNWVFIWLWFFYIY
jgi:hypothetical protein